MELLEARKFGVHARLLGLGINPALNQDFINQVFDNEMSRERRARLLEAYRFGWTIADIATNKQSTPEILEKMPFMQEFNKLKKIIDNEKKTIGGWCTIQWHGERDTHYYYISFGTYNENGQLDSFGVHDDTIFYYVEDENALKLLMKETAVHGEFKILNYELVSNEAIAA